MSGYTAGALPWRDGQATIFGRDQRSLPLFIDSCGYRREITRTAPRWAHRFATYVEAIALLQPDGYAAWDYPESRQQSMAAQHELMRIYPDDVRSGPMWPVYSIRWPIQAPSRSRLDPSIPINTTQRAYTPASREHWARWAVELARAVANDPDFQFMVERFNQVMIGGMIAGPLPRMVRHLFAAILCALYPQLQLWLLGQANFATVNDLGVCDRIQSVWLDGSWYLQDARCERFAYVDGGLITMLQIGTGMDDRGQALRQTFFTLSELMAANLRSLLAAYQGLIQWPAIPLPIDLRDRDQLPDLRRHYQLAQLELGI